MHTLSRTHTLALLDAGAHITHEDSVPVTRDEVQNYEPHRNVVFVLAKTPVDDDDTFTLIETRISN